MMLVDFDSLPKEIQDSIGDPRTMQHPLIDFSIRSTCGALLQRFSF